MTVFERGWLSCNNVLFQGDGGGQTLLVDTGYWTHQEQTVLLVRRALGQGGTLDRIVNTHLHSDHCGGNSALQAKFGCAVDVPSGDVSKVDAWDESALTYKATGQHCPRFQRTGSVSAGSEIICAGRPWQAIATPGHDPESIVLYQPELQLLISADALWENGFGVVFPELEGADAFDDVRRTLDLLARLRVRWVIPGHGAPFQDHSAAVERAHRRLDAFVAQPDRHAQHAAKVLIKFRLMERRSEPSSALMSWLAATPYLGLVHKRYFNGFSFDDWCDALLGDLCKRGAIKISEGVVCNC
jgi:glyoxylase-like metal-dependent hydrolase (beta-lactamase superfamily II)